MSLGGRGKGIILIVKHCFFWFVQFTKEADILDLFNYECDSAAYFGQYNTCKCPYWGEI